MPSNVVGASVWTDRYFLKELVNLINVTLSHGCSEVDFNNAKPFHVALKTADAIMYSNKELYYLNLRNSEKN